MIGLSKTKLYDMVDKDEFPAAVSLGSNSVGWYEDEVQDWLSRRSRRRPSSRSDPPNSEKDDEREHPVRPRGCELQPDKPDLPSRAGTTHARRQIADSRAYYRAEVRETAASKDFLPIGMRHRGRQVFCHKPSGNLVVILGTLSVDWPDDDQ